MKHQRTHDATCVHVRNRVRSANLGARQWQACRAHVIVHVHVCCTVRALVFRDRHSMGLIRV
jgi:hypothetical protein